MKPLTLSIAALALFSSTTLRAPAQVPMPPAAAPVQMRSTAELDQMLGPVALYPDPLLAQLLPAATLPEQIVLADRYVSGGGDPNQIDSQPWDASVRALARYPSVLKWMDDNLAWTTEVGQAFLYQQQDVMYSVQRLRGQAMALGNLQSTPQQNVVNDAGTIEILPPDPQVMYVPVYQPSVVFYQRGFGAGFISFGLGFNLGIWLNHDFDWHHHDLIVWHHDNPRPADWWVRRPAERPREEIQHTVVWQARNRPAPAPALHTDRGYAPRPVHQVVQPRPVEHHESPPPVVRHTEPPAQYHPAAPAPARTRPASGVLVGVQSAHDTHQFSQRGQQSRQTLPGAGSPPHASPPHASPPQHSSGTPPKH